MGERDCSVIRKILLTVTTATLVVWGSGHAEVGAEALEQEAEQFEDAEIAARNALFEKLDLSGDGYISRVEAMANEDLSAQFDALDRAGDGRISRAEFAGFDFELGTPEQPATPSAVGAAEQRATASSQQGDHEAEQTSGGVAERPGARSPEEGAENVLILRAHVAEMAYETVSALGEHTLISVEEPVGWAVFAVDPPSPDLDPGVGMARHERGEVYFLAMRGVPYTDESVRYVLTFSDAGLFREFRQGAVDGPTLERARVDGFIEAYQINLAEQMEVQPIEVAAFEFDLDVQLERGLEVTPSRTAPLVDQDYVPTHDN